MKKKAKKPVKDKDLELDYVSRPLPGTQATEFKFNGFTVIGIHVPSVGTFVIGTGREGNSPRHCWVYEPEISMQEAIGKAFGDILRFACQKLGIKSDK